MSWYDIDGARAHLTRDGARPPSRKVIYAMVKDGLQVAKIGRRIWFCDVWINSYMESKASSGNSRTPNDRLLDAVDKTTAKLTDVSECRAGRAFRISTRCGMDRANGPAEG